MDSQSHLQHLHVIRIHRPERCSSVPRAVNEKFSPSPCAEILPQRPQLAITEGARDMWHLCMGLLECLCVYIWGYSKLDRTLLRFLDFLLSFLMAFGASALLVETLCCLKFLRCSWSSPWSAALFLFLLF